uniref:Uncharacterized protein n=1 Tax=Amphimedon queenslandica TaxID=400682 RepID=A0A1X7TUE9_AMPQE
MTILGHLMSLTSCETVERNSTEYKYRGKKKKYVRSSSCSSTVSDGTYKKWRRHFLQNGMQPRVHGNTGHIQRHALSVEGVKDVVAFLENYAEDYRILLPWRIPGVRAYQKDKILPSTVSRSVVYRQYADAGRERALSESSFKRISRKHVPQIYSIKPMMYIC